MTDEQKARLEELKKIAEADLTAEQKIMLADLTTIETQGKRITDQEAFIGTKATELGELKTKLAEAKPEDKVALQDQVDDKEAVIKSLTEAMEMAKDATERVAKTISLTTPGDQSTVDQPTVDALEDKLFAVEGGKEAMEKAVESMTDEEYADFTSDLPYRMKVMSAAMSAVGGEETVRSAWRKKEEVKGTPTEDEEKTRMNELFNSNQRQHRFIPGGGGGGPIHRSGPSAKADGREVDTRAH